MTLRRIESSLDEEPPAEPIIIDCEKGKAKGCGAKCCSFWFGLTPREAKEGVIKFNPKIPYMIMRGEDGYCVHLDKKTLRCEIWDKRPEACRRYSCERDERIWG